MIDRYIKQIDGWMDGWLDGWMDGWMNGWTDIANVLTISTVCVSDASH